jgi:hypothetical protein
MNEESNILEKKIEDAFSMKSLGAFALTSTISEEQKNELIGGLDNAVGLIKGMVLKSGMMYALREFGGEWYLFQIKPSDIEVHMKISKNTKHNKIDDLLKQLKELLNAAG